MMPEPVRHSDNQIQMSPHISRNSKQKKNIKLQSYFMRYTYILGYVRYSAAARSSFSCHSCSQHHIKQREEDGTHVLELRPLMTGVLMSHQTFCLTLFCDNSPPPG